VVFTTRPFCQHLAGLGLALKKGLRRVELMNVRAAVFFLFTAAVALFVHPADTGDLAFFVHTSQKWLWDWFADPSVQVGPLQLLAFRVGDLAGVLALVVQLGVAALLWVTSGRLLAGRDPWIRFAVCMAAVVLGLTYGAYQDGHPAQVVVPLLWVLAGCDAREGRTVHAGALVGLSAGFEVWGLLGAVVFVLAPQARAALRGLAAEVGVAVALFLPFVLAGDFRMFEYHWQVNADTLKSRAHGHINKAQGMPGSITTTAQGRAGGTANVRGTGDLKVVGPSEVDGVERSDVPQEYRDQVRQYFQP